MKKNDVIILLSACLFSGLFYAQLPGINYLLFTLLLSVALLICHPQCVHDKRWWYYCACTVLAGLAVFAVNSQLSLIACVICCLVLSSKTLPKSSSVILSLLYGIVSLLSGHMLWIAERMEAYQQNRGTQQQQRSKVAGSILIAIVVAMAFFYLYRLSNPLFDKYAAIINFDWLSMGWILFTVFGLIVMCGLLRNRGVEQMLRAEQKALQDIADAGEPSGAQQSSVVIPLVLFALLNFMLLCMNGLDVMSIYVTQKLPDGITLSDFVHQAVWSTVMSIVIALSLIAWFFRGDLNFDVAGKKVKLLVYLWIAQSALVVINTMIRNYWYMHEYQLTHLRMGVFVFLLLCLVGLALTWLKISKRRSAWYLVASNFEVWFALLVMASLINWDRTITRYNIAHAESVSLLDKEYLLRLSDANLPELVELYHSNGLTESEKARIIQKVLKTYYRDRFTQWQSYSLRMGQNVAALEELVR